MCLLKEISVIVARCMLFRRNISCCQLPQYKEKETITEQCRQQSSLGVEHIKTFVELLCTPSFASGLHQRFTFSHQCTFFSPSHHSLQILSSLLPFTRNLPSTRRTNSITIL